MWAISKQLSVFLNLYRSNQVLAENQQFDTFNRMSAFLAHDLKNILAQLQLLAANGKQHKNNPEFIDDAFDTIDASIARLTKVVNHLRKKELQEVTTNKFELAEAIQQACNNRISQLPVPIFSNNTNKTAWLSGDQERFINVLTHLIQNAQEATPADGQVEICVSVEDEQFIITIEDTGCGMDEEFIATRLFKPFDTTKGNSGMGIGAYDAKKMVEQLNGYISVKSAHGVGSTFTLTLPAELS